MRIVTICEKEFLTKCIAKNCRLDGRSLLDGRKLDISFGQEWGCCIVWMGNTQVLAQVSAEVTEPKAVTPTEGALHINLELSAMSAPDIQNQSRISDEFVEFQRVLERCIRDSKCIDLESLCIVAGSKVWTIRVDIHTLNDDGNLVECSSIAAISALAHFKRPDVTVIGTDVKVHSLDDREPIPLNLHHMPICINMALYDQGQYILVDPLEIEERIADGCYMIGMNAHQEICLIHRKGVLLLSLDTIEKCEDIATRRSQAVTKIIRKALDDNAYNRATNAPIGFVNMIQTGTILGSKASVTKIDLHEIAKQAEVIEVSVGDTMDVIEETNKTANQNRPKTSPPKPSQAGIKAAELLKEAERGIFEGGTSKWKNFSSSESSEEDEEEMKIEANVSDNSLKKEVDSSSEDETIEVSSKDLKPSTARGWYSKDPFD